MEEQTNDTTRPAGKTTIAPDVLLTIARLTTLGIKGVSQMAPVPGGVSWISKRHQADGIRIEIEDNRVYAEIYVILGKGFNVREVSRNIQHEVARSITEMVGMEVGRVNIHIENINYPSESEAEAQD
jgi:uncharacterized alkaline shock family protein YloU